MPVDKTKLCLVCKTRKQALVNGTCTRCNALLEAEGTHRKYGIKKETPAQQRLRERANEYNRLARKGMTQQQIADSWGLPRNVVSSMVFRAKTRLGMKMVNLALACKGEIPQATNKTRPHVNEHGGGRWGKRNCTCDLCKERRRSTRATYNKAYVERHKEAKAAYMKGYRQRAKKRKAQQQENSDVTRETMPS